MRDAALPIDWSRIVDDHARRIFHAAFRILGNAADAEDVVQDVFLEASALTSPENVRNWGAYLRRLAVFRALDHRRRRRGNVCLEHALLLASELSPPDEAIHRELAEQLRDLIAGLPEREGAVFSLYYFERLSNSEIAETLGIRAGAVAAAMHKVRSKLEARIAEARTGDVP